MNTIPAGLLVSVIAYLAGSLPSGFLTARFAAGIDIRCVLPQAARACTLERTDQTVSAVDAADSWCPQRMERDSSFS